MRPSAYTGRGHNGVAALSTSREEEPMTRLAILSAVLFVSTSALPLARASEQAARGRTMQAKANAPAQAGAPSAHYCNLGFFTPEGLARHKALVEKIAAAVTESNELENGYLFKFSGQFREAGEWLDGVRGCCPTIEYEATFAPQSGPATLRIWGGPGAKEFIREEFSRIIH